MSAGVSQLNSANRAAPEFRYWRLYLALHLAVVLATAIGVGNEASLSGNQLGSAFIGLLLASLLMFYASPIVLILLFLAAGHRHSRYAIAGAVEVVLWLGHMLALLPAVQ